MANNSILNCETPHLWGVAPWHALVLSILLTMLTGCAIATVKADEHFEESQVKQIVPDLTSRSEVTQAFGIPVAVAKQGMDVSYPPPDIRKVGYRTIPGNVFLDLFTPKHKIRPSHRVYYYYSVELKASSVFACVTVNNSKLVTDELWILIDDQTGLVVDYIFEDRK